MGIIRISLTHDGENQQLEKIVSKAKTQKEINRSIKKMLHNFNEVFEEMGRATKVPSIEMEVDTNSETEAVVPLQELVREGVVTPLQRTNGTGWIHNIVITAKKNGTQTMYA